LSEAFACSSKRQNTIRDGIAIVDISGPLEHRAHAFWDSYEEILERVELALAEASPAVILRINSPGGEADGCLEAARRIRAMSAAANKPIYAHVDKRACSAAYALASGADKIYCDATAILGSIGVLAVREDLSLRNAMAGLRVSLITSGARKADGNPDIPATDAELEASQTIVNELAELFFTLVRDLRGVDTQPLEAGIFLGASAVRERLADAVMPLDALISLITTNGAIAMTAMEEARAALAKIAAGEGPEAIAAKRALAAMDEEPKPEPDAEGDDPEPDAEGDDPEPDAEGDEPDGDEGEPKPKPKAAAAKAAASAARATRAGSSAAAMAAKALRKIEALQASIAQEREAALREAVYAQRPDWTPELRASMAKAPLAAVRDFARTLPVQPAGATATAALAAASAAGTQGAAVTGPRLPAAEAASLAMAMGLVGEQRGIISSDHKLSLGVVLPAAPAAANGAKP
jgi:ClpP class serine protease